MPILPFYTITLHSVQKPAGEHARIRKWIVRGSSKPEQMCKCVQTRTNFQNKSADPTGNCGVHDQPARGAGVGLRMRATNASTKTSELILGYLAKTGAAEHGPLPDRD